MPLNTFDQAPLKNALVPSSLAIFFQQSIVPLYIISAAETDIKVRRLEVIQQVCFNFHIFKATRNKQTIAKNLKLSNQLMNRDFNSPQGNQNKSSLSLLSEHDRNNKKSYGKHIAIFFKDSNKIISFPIRQNPPSISHHISMKRYFLLPEHRRSAYSYLPFGQTASSSYVAQYQKGKKPALLLQ